MLIRYIHLLGCTRITFPLCVPGLLSPYCQSQRNISPLSAIIPIAIVPISEGGNFAPASDFLALVDGLAIEVESRGVIVAVDVFGGGVVTGKV
jgi:hypothetical protein